MFEYRQVFVWTRFHFSWLEFPRSRIGGLYGKRMFNIKSKCLRLGYPLQLSCGFWSYIFSPTFTLSLFVFLSLNCVSCKQHIVGSCFCFFFIQSVSALWLDCLFTFNIVIDIVGLTCAIIHFFPYVSYFLVFGTYCLYCFLLQKVGISWSGILISLVLFLNIFFELFHQ